MTLDQFDPLVSWLAMRIQQIGLKHGPRQVYIEIWIVIEQSRDRRQEEIELFLMTMQLHAGACMCPDEASVRMITQWLFQLRQVQRVTLALGSDIGVQHHGQIELGSQMIDLRQRLVVGTWSAAFSKRSD